MVDVNGSTVAIDDEVSVNRHVDDAIDGRPDAPFKELGVHAKTAVQSLTKSGRTRPCP